SIWLVFGPSTSFLRAEDRFQQVRLELDRAVHELQVREGAVGALVGELLGQVADPVGAGERRQVERAEDAERVPRRIEEAAPRVARDPGGEGGDEVGPAGAFVGQQEALLRA